MGVDYIHMDCILRTVASNNIIMPNFMRNTVVRFITALWALLLVYANITAYINHKGKVLTSNSAETFGDGTISLLNHHW